MPSIRFEHKEDVVETWIPSVTVSKLTPTREAKLSNGLDLLTVSEIYEGESNPVNLLLTQRIKFLCSFVDSMKNYPFKDQNCSFYIFIVRIFLFFCRCFCLLYLFLDFWFIFFTRFALFPSFLPLFCSSLSLFYCAFWCYVAGLQ